jgi:hypothetical protein
VRAPDCDSQAKTAQTLTTWLTMRWEGPPGRTTRHNDGCIIVENTTTGTTMASTTSDTRLGAGWRLPPSQGKAGTSTVKGLSTLASISIYLYNYATITPKRDRSPQLYCTSKRSTTSAPLGLFAVLAESLQLSSYRLVP